MPKKDYPLTQKEFEEIYSKVPRLTVEIIIINEDNQIYLTKRSIEPCKGQWHLPGGTVRFGELLVDAVARIAKRELSITVLKSTNVGYIEYPSHFNHGLDSPVGIVFEVTDYTGKLAPNSESFDYGWYSNVPINMHADQDVYLLKNDYLK